MAGKNKQIEIGKIAEEQEEDFMFPHNPHPVTIRAKTMKEAEEKFNKIISNIEKNND